MAEYLSAMESLHEMCRSDPPRYKLDGTLNSIFGVGIIALGAALGFEAYGVNELAIADSGQDIISAGFVSTLGAGSLFTSAVGGILTLHGISSVLNSNLPHNSNGYVYYTNNGFTDNPTLVDRLFGSIVSPLDSAKTLPEGYVAANGVTVVRGEYRQVSGGEIPEFEASIECVLKGYSVSAYSITENEEFAHAITKIRDVHLFGKSDGRKIDIIRIGSAYTRAA